MTDQLSRKGTRMKLKQLLAGLALAVFGTAAMATWWLNADGTGFVGKGDVQVLYGWNNKQLQTNAPGVTFTYNTVTAYTITCEWWTGPTNNRKVHQVDHKRSAGILSSLAYEARKNSNGKDGDITGFFLRGWGSITEDSGDVPAIGAACPGEPGTGAIVIAVDVTSTSGGLYVTFGGVTYLLPVPPPPVVL